MEHFEISKQEKAFIRRLKSATMNIPQRLWLFCSESGLHVMRTNDTGEVVFSQHHSIDQDYIVDTITDQCSSGSWYL